MSDGSRRNCRDRSGSLIHEERRDQAETKEADSHAQGAHEESVESQAIHRRL